MRNLIEFSQEYLIECDNPECNYKVKNKRNSTKDAGLSEIAKHVNEPCPLCGQILLTYKDYIAYIKLIRIVKWINKWFSWITVFYKKKETKEIEVHVYDGIKIKEE